MLVCLSVVSAPNNVVVGARSGAMVENVATVIDSGTPEVRFPSKFDGNLTSY
jgi:hypothetical protein